MLSRFKDTETETVFVNLYRSQESIPRNLFRQPMKPGGPERQPYSYTRFLAPKDCSKIQALYTFNDGHLRTVKEKRRLQLCTGKKENKNIYKEIQKGVVAKSYMTNSLLIYD
jgi:hypothetical protein